MTFDFAKTYRRIHYDGVSFLRCMSVFDNYAFLQLRLSFGGMSCPASWCPISEFIIDIAKDFLSNLARDPSKYQSPDQHFIPATEYLPQRILLEPALPTMLLPPDRQSGVPMSASKTSSQPSWTTSPTTYVPLPQLH
jgi:hypothetical protein